MHNARVRRFYPDNYIETRIEFFRNIAVSVLFFLRNKFSGTRMAISYEVFNCPRASVAINDVLQQLILTTYSV